MHSVLIHNESRELPAPLKVVFCNSFLCRLRGLTFRRSLTTQEGLLLVQKNDSKLDASIHMMGVFFDLGIVWINSKGEVVDLCLAKRWHPAYFPAQPACWTLEIHPSRLGEFRIGDKINLDETPLA